MTKLTKAQMDLLTDAAARGQRGVYAYESYKPRQKLVSLGLVEVSPGGTLVIITEKGFEFLRRHA